MEPSKFNDRFVKFPYRKAVRENGDVNNGGIDLVQNPERISEIHELQGVEWFRNFIISINSPDGLFMTLGCVHGPEEDYAFGYVDFSLRPTAPTELRSSINSLDSLFYSYLQEAIKEGENSIRHMAYAKQALVWESSPLEIYAQTYEKVSLTFRYRDAAGIAWIFDHLEYFLTVHFPSAHLNP